MDKYGNVLYRLAEPGSPLYGQIDHWFPVASKPVSKILWHCHFVGTASIRLFTLTFVGECC